MPLLYTVAAFFSFEKAATFLLPCPFKYLSGYDCPGCGFQRAVLALVKGDFQESFILYPPAIPFLLTVVISMFVNRWLPAYRSKRIINTLSLITGCIIILNYVYKVSGI